MYIGTAIDPFDIKEFTSYLFELQENYWSLKDDKYKLEVMLPGVKKSEIKTYIKDNIFYTEVDDKSYIGGEVFKTLLPKDLKVKSIKGKLELGVLTFTADKKEDDVLNIDIC